MTEDRQDHENAKNFADKFKAEYENQFPNKANLLPEFILSDEEMQKVIDAISYAEYGVLNDSFIE